VRVVCILRFFFLKGGNNSDGVGFFVSILSMERRKVMSELMALERTYDTHLICVMGGSGPRYLLGLFSIRVSWVCFELRFPNGCTITLHGLFTNLHLRLE